MPVVVSFAQKNRISSEFTEMQFEKAFDENGQAIIKRDQYGQDEWQSLPGAGKILSEVVGKRLLIDTQLKIRTTGEFQRFDQFSREVRTVTTYTDSILSGNTDRYYVGPWERTGFFEWRPIFFNIRQYPVGGRICPVSCGLTP